MDFRDIDIQVQNKIMELLNKHIATSVDSIKADHILLPILIIPDSNQLLSLQPKSGKTDVDKAYEFAINKLKNEPFTYALFSYSTKVGFENGKISDAIKTYVFTSHGIEVSFFTPYSMKGIFKKTINVEKTIIGEVKDDILD